MLTHYFSHLELMKYFPVCTEAQTARVMANLRAASARTSDSLSQDTSLHTKMLLTGRWDHKFTILLVEGKK